MSNTKICRDLDRVHPYVKQQALKVVADCEAAGLSVAIFETIRTFERQKWLKANGKSKTLNSYHRLGLAIDFVFLTKSGNWTWRVKDEKWDQLAEIMERHGFSSLWKRSGWDGPHGEVRFKGVYTSTLYKELKNADNDLEKFWRDCVDPRLKELGLWEPTVEEAIATEVSLGTKEIAKKVEKEIYNEPEPEPKFDGLEKQIKEAESIPQAVAVTPQKSWWQKLLEFFFGG